MTALWPAVVTALGLGGMFVFHKCLSDWFDFRRELKLADAQHAQLNDRISALDKSLADFSEQFNTRVVRLENQAGIYATRSPHG